MAVDNAANVVRRVGCDENRSHRYDDQQGQPNFENRSHPSEDITRLEVIVKKQLVAESSPGRGLLSSGQMGCACREAPARSQFGGGESYVSVAKRDDIRRWRFRQGTSPRQLPLRRSPYSQQKSWLALLPPVATALQKQWLGSRLCPFSGQESAKPVHDLQRNLTRVEL